MLWWPACHHNTETVHAWLCTGKPKGVMLTHAAMVSEVASITTFLQEGEIACGEGDSILSYLTLAHILDRVVEDFLLSAGGCIGYWQVLRLFHSSMDD